MMRYTAAKELSHILVDSEDDWNPDGPGTIDKLLLQHASPGEYDSSVLSENLAGYVATELLYPYEHRITDAKLVEDGRGDLGIAFHALRNTGSHRWDSDSSSIYEGHWNNLGCTCLGLRSTTWQRLDDVQIGQWRSTSSYKPPLKPS